MVLAEEEVLAVRVHQGSQRKEEHGAHILAEAVPRPVLTGVLQVPQPMALADYMVLAMVVVEAEGHLAAT